MVEKISLVVEGCEFVEKGCLVDLRYEGRDRGVYYLVLLF